MIGYGSYHYKYSSGREGDWFLTGFAPRKRDLTVYVMPVLSPHKSLLSKLGKCKTGACCLYIRWLADIEIPVLREIIEKSIAHTQELYP